MKRSFIIFSLLLCMLFSGCANMAKPEKKQYTATFLELFDTVTTVIGQDTSEESFKEKAQSIRANLEYYHRLFDVYNDYEGLANVKTINDSAGVQPVVVDEALISFLLDCKSYYELTDKKVNVAMGSVLRLWHDARTDGLRDPLNAELPDTEQLKKAAEHTSFDSVIIDEENSSVFITDPQLSLDVGAVAKGWAAQRVAEVAPEGMLISVGGNVCATGPKIGEFPWIIGIQDPDDPGKNLHALYLTKGAVVTSGDYQRVYAVDGKAYHHIIDPETLMPSSYWSSVSVITGDSGLADALSTGLFLMNLEQGKILAEKCGVEVLWVDQNGTEFMTPGFESMLRN